MADLKKATREGIEYFNKGKLDEWAKMMSPDAELVTPLSGTHKGPQAIKAWFAQTRVAFPDARVDVHRVVVEGNVVVVEYTVSGTNSGPLHLPTGEELAPTGKAIRVPSLDIGVYDDAGKLSSLHQYFDVAGIFQQLGLMPAPAITHA